MCTGDLRKKCFDFGATLGIRMPKSVKSDVRTCRIDVSLLGACAVVKIADTLTFSCDSSSMTNSPCRLTPAPRDIQTLRFPNQRTQYNHLLKQGVDVVAKNPKRSSVTSNPDIALLRSLALDECHPAETTRLWSGDLLRLCTPSNLSAVVLFIRGLCDRCNFEPIGLKKKTE